jgi:hypothetical protein
VAEPMSDERLEQIVQANDTGAGLLWGDARVLLAEVVRLRAALEHAERERYLTGWRDARDQAARVVAKVHLSGKAAFWAAATLARLVDDLREMQP